MKQPKTNDYVINARLRKIFRLAKSDVELEGTLSEIDALEGFLPFSINEALITHQQVRVIPSVLRPKPSSFLWQFLENDVGLGYSAIVTDEVLEGIDCIYAVTMCSDGVALTEEAERWLKAMPNSPCLLIGNHRGVSLMAAPLTSFT